MKARAAIYGLAALAFVVALLATASARAETAASEPGWIADSATGCRIWSGHPQADMSVTWSGVCRDGMGQGKGVLQWSGAGSRRFEGELHDGKATGTGAEIFPSGSRYDGEFRDGLRNGHGTYTYANGDRYEGEWRDGKAEGQGLKLYTSGNRYEGTFHDGHYNGHGVFTWADDDRYEGNFVDDKPEGRGIFIWHMGDRYEGEFRSGKRSGHGVAIFGNGARYDGQWRDGKPNGSGVYLSGRDKFSGNWVEGCFHDGSRRAFVAVAASACR